MYQGPIIDCDVHQEYRSQEDLLPYFSDGWKEYVEGPGREGLIGFHVFGGYDNPNGFFRWDTFPPSGGPPGSDPDFMREQLLDRFNIDRAVLTFGTPLDLANIPNPYFAAALARAANQWMIEEWLSADDRFYGSLIVANQLPDIAAQEIRRLGRHPKIAQVIMSSNGVGLPFGHPLFHPIYEAAVEMGLPVAIHAGGQGGINPCPTASGPPSLYIEYHTLVTQGVMTTLVSLITEGVFEIFPRLRVILIEGGVAWVPAILWRFDALYKRSKHLRREIPWVKRLPSEYCRDHIRITTQPLEIPPNAAILAEALESIGGDEILLFATDYPHWDADEVKFISERLPRSWLPKIFRENAMKVYGWE